MSDFDNWLANGNQTQNKPQSDFDNWLANSNQQENQQLQASMNQGMQAQPDRQARILKMQLRTGLPEQFIDQNLDAVETKAKQSDFDPDAFRKNSPLVAKFMADPANAKLAHDDVANLSGFEWLMKAPAAAYEEGQKQLLATKLNYDQMLGNLTPDESKQLSDLEAQQPNNFGASGWLQDALIETAKSAPGIIDYVENGLEGAIPGMLAGGGAAFLAGGETPAGLVTIPAAAATGGGLGFATASTEENYKLNTGMAYQQLKQLRDVNGQPLDPQVLQIASSIAGVINTGLDTITFGSLSKTIPGIDKIKSLGGTDLLKQALKSPTAQEALKNFAGRYAGAVSAQTLAQTGKQVIDLIAQEAAKNYQGGFKKADYPAMGDQLMQAADGALKVSALLSLPGPSADFFGDYLKSRQAKNNVETMRNISNVAKKSKLLQRAPDKLKQLMKSLKADSPVKNVFIPSDRWRELFQTSNIDPEKMAGQVMGDGGQQYREAVATGGDLVIPIEDYTTKLAGSQFHDRLLDDIRLDPEQMTNREANEWDASRQEQAQQAVQKAATLFSKKDPTQFIYDGVYKQIKDTGASSSEAEAQAKQMQSVIRTISSRTGIDPQTIWKRYGPRIKRELPEQLKNAGGDFDIAIDPIIDQLRTGKVPTDKEVYGESMMERLRRTGIIDEGGELSARDVDANTQPFQRRLVREPKEGEQSYTLDEAARAMAEEGYLHAPIGEVGQDELLEAIDKEMSGDPVYSDQNYNEKAAKQQDFLNTLSDYLDESNIDLNQVSNDEIKKLLGQDVPEEGEVTDDLYQDKKGKLTISDKGYDMTLFDKSDASTVLHESGHLYLEILSDLEKRGELTESMKGDMQSIRDWVGNDGGAWTTDQHEQFARGFESYLREGKAPTVGLQRAFAKFRAWLLQLYRSASALKVNMTDEVRGVFDRLLATDSEIKNAEHMQDYERLFENADEAGMTEKQFEAYKQSVMDARDDAETSIAKTYYRELENQRKGATKEVTQEVYNDIAARPVYQVISYLRRGKLNVGELPEGIEPTKLSKNALVELKGEGWLKRLPKGLYKREGGADPDSVAMIFGYTSGDEMLQDIVNAPNLEDAIKAEVEKRMVDKYGDVFKDGTLAEKSMRAVHNDARGKVIAMELRSLARRSNKGKPTPAEIIKSAAESVIAKKKVSETHSRAYLAAERKAANDAQQASAKGDINAAAEAKQRQQLNFYLYKAAAKAETRAENNRNYLYKFATRSYQERLGKAGEDYLNAVNELLEKTDFKRISLQQIERRKSLAQFISEQEEKGYSVDIPENLIYQSGLTNYKDMTHEQLEGLRDGVQNIYHLANFKNKLLKKQGKKDFDDLVDDIVGTIEENNRSGYKPQVFVQSKLGKLKQEGLAFIAMHTKMEFLFEMLDGKAHGTMWNALFKPLADAEDNELVMAKEYREKYQTILDEYTPKERAKWYTQSRHIDGIGKFNKARALSLGLNWGNAGNREAVLRGFYKLDGTRWTEADVNRIFRTFLDKRDWDTIQKTWDMIDELYPQIAQLQKDLTGLAPEKVDSVPVQTDFGEYKGGYFPLKSDKQMSFKAFTRDFVNDVKGTSELFGANFARPATKKGFTIERTNFGGQPVRLDLNVVGEHLNEVIHDLTHRKAIMDVDKLTSDKRVQDAIINAVGMDMYKQIRPWLSSIAGDNKTIFSGYEKLMSRARVGATVVNMGLKVTTALSQLSGIIQSAAELGPGVIYEGMKFWSQPWQWKATADYVGERSVMMRTRRNSFDRDVKHSIEQIMTKNGFISDVERGYFYFTGMLDMGVAIPTWTAAYKKAMDGGIETIAKGDDKAAAEYADRTVRVTQSAGSAKDLAQIQRGSESFKLFTMFYSYMNGAFNQLQKAGYDFKLGRMSTPQFLAYMSYIWLIPALTSELSAGRGPDKDESAAGWAAKTALIYPFDTMIGIRDIADATVGDWDYEASPAFEAVAGIPASLKDAKQVIIDGKPMTRSQAKQILMTASYWGQLPGRQAWITGSYMYDLMTGNAQPSNPFEFIHDMVLPRKTK